MKDSKKWDFQEAILLCEVIGAFYLCYYVFYFSLNLILLIYDYTSLSIRICSLFNLIGQFFKYSGSLIKSKYASDMAL